MRKWAKLVTENPAVVLVVVCFITVFFLLQFRNLRFENRFTSWVPREDPVLRIFLETGEKFGTNELVMVAIKAKKGGTFSPQILKRVKALTEVLSEKPEIFLVTSIANAPDIRKMEDGIEVRDLLDEIPEDETELRRLKEYILSKENFVNNVISSDGRWLAMAVYLRSDKKSDPIKSFQQVIKPTVEKYLGDVAEVYYSGDPSDAYYANRFSTDDLKFLTPLVILLIILVLFFSFKSWQGVVYPLLVVILATIWTFGTMSLLRKPMDMLTPILPVLLIALGSAYGIHVLNKILHEENVAEATRKILVPVLMAGLTTIAGFLSFATAKLSLIVNLGVFSALGILYAMVISLTAIPALMVLFPQRPQSQQKKYSYSSLLRPLSRAVFSSRWMVAGVFLVIFAFFSLWIPGIQREVNFTEYYPPDSIPRKSLRIIKEHFGGAYPVTLYFKAEGIKSPGVLKAMRMAEDYLYSLKETSLPFSVADLIEELNYQLNGRYHIPSTSGEIANLWFFMEGRKEISQIMTPNAREALVFAKLPEASTSLMRRTYLKLRNFLEKTGKFELYDLKNLPPGQREKARRAEEEWIEKEMGWLGEKYGVKIKMGGLAGIHHLMPRVSDPEVVGCFSRELEVQVLSPDFEFEIPFPRGKRLVRKILALIKRGIPGKEELIKTLKEEIPSSQWDAGTGEDVASAFSYKLRECQNNVFVKRAWLKLDIENGNKYFQKKARGLLWEIADDIVVLPEGSLPFPGERINLKIYQSGFPAAMTRLDHFLYISQLQSLGIALILTFILMVALRKSLAVGAISTTPIIFTLGVIYGFLGLSGIPLTYATMMIAGVSIGVGIDYAIHFIHGFYQELEGGEDIKRAIQKTYIEKGRAILSNSIAVILGFAVLLFSRLKPLHQFGGTMMGSMFLAALGALSFLPALLLILKEKGGEK